MDKIKIELRPYGERYGVIELKHYPYALAAIAMADLAIYITIINCAIWYEIKEIYLYYVKTDKFNADRVTSILREQLEIERKDLMEWRIVEQERNDTHPDRKKAVLSYIDKALDGYDPSW